MAGLHLLMFITAICSIQLLHTSDAAAQYKANTKFKVATASVFYTYREVNTIKERTVEVTGRYALGSPVNAVSGHLVHVQTSDGANNGCDDVINAPGAVTEVGGDWLALVQRGECRFAEKMLRAVVGNASAVIVYDSVDGDLVTMEHSVNHVTSVFVSRQDGERLAELADNNLLSNVTIAVKHVLSYRVVANTGAVTPASLIAVITMVTLVLLLVAIFLGRAIWKKYRAKTSKHKKATAIYLPIARPQLVGAGSRSDRTAGVAGVDDVKEITITPSSQV